VVGGAKQIGRSMACLAGQLRRTVWCALCRSGSSRAFSAAEQVDRRSPPGALVAPAKGGAGGRAGRRAGAASHPAQQITTPFGGSAELLGGFRAMSDAH